MTLSRKESRDNRKTEGNGDDPRTRLGIGMRRRGRDKMQHFATECNTGQGPTRTRHARNTYTALDGRAGVMHFAQLLINFGSRLIVVVPDTQMFGSPCHIFARHSHGALANSE